jgi:hypothetical protein
MTSRTYIDYNPEDGLHLRCRECDAWDALLGLRPSAAETYAKALMHVAQAHNGKPSMDGTRHLDT